MRWPRGSRSEIAPDELPDLPQWACALIHHPAQALPDALHVCQGRPLSLGCWRPPDVSQIWCLLLIAASVGALCDGKAVALIEALGPYIRYERPQLQPARPALLGQLNEPGAEPAAGPCRVHVQLLDPVTVQDHQPQQRAVIGDCQPGLLFIQNTQVYDAQRKVAPYPEETSRLVWQHHTFAPLTPLSSSSGGMARPKS